MSTFQILIDRLKGGQNLKIVEQLSPGFLGPEERELVFRHPVSLKGEAYLTSEHLILHLKAKTLATIPCAVCNKMIDVELKVEDFYHAEPIENISGAIFDFSPPLREALLIELPRTAECNQGNCSERSSLAPYLRTKDHSSFPFADMDKNLN